MKVSIAQALQQLPAKATEQYPNGAPFITMMSGGTMSVEVFSPKSSDLQKPHRQDELYFIHSGRGELTINNQRYECAAGDAFFVAAGAQHRFENFSNDFVTWVVFYGPQVGE